MKRKLSFILSLCMLFSAVSCQKSDKGTSSAEKLTSAEAHVIKSDKAYHLRELPMPSESSGVISTAPLGDGKYITAFRSAESVIPEFYITDGDFSTYTTHDTQISFRENAEIFLRLVISADGTLYMAVTEITHGDMPPYNYMNPDSDYEDFDWDTYKSSAEYFHSVYRMTADGTAEAKTDIIGLGENTIEDFTVCGGKFYFFCGMNFIADVNSGQAEEYKPKEYESFGSLGVTSSDTLISSVYRENEAFLSIGGKLLSIEGTGEPVSHFSNGGNEYDTVYAGKTGFYGIKGDTVTELAQNVQLGIKESSADEILAVENGFVISAFDELTSRHKLYLLTDIIEEDAPSEPVTLRLGVMYNLEDFMSHVAAFNRSGSNITIEPVYYTEYDIYDKSKDEQVSTGTEKLAMDLITGEAPDLAFFMKTPLDLKSKGAFADMYELMDNELNSGMILPNILEACDYDGKLYSLPISFTVRSMLVKEKFSGIEGQTFDEMLSTIDNAPSEMKFINNAFNIEILVNMLSYSDYAISGKNGRYSVDEDNMEKLLEFCNRFSGYSEDVWAEPLNDEVLFSEFAASEFGHFRTSYESFGEPVVFAGYPSLNNEGNVAVMHSNIAVMDNCTNKEEAWEFVKSIYIGENSNITHGINMEFPILVSEIEQLAEVAKNSKGFTDEELDKAVEVIKSAKRPVNGLPNDLFRIITEEAQPYFAGECSASDAASYIKSRTDIYISENE